MNMGVLETTSQALLAPGRGTLAADESHGTIARRFEALGVEARRSIDAVTGRCCSRRRGCPSSSAA